MMMGVRRIHMDVRQATTDDMEGIRRAGTRSLKESYGFLDEELVETAIEKWYADDPLEASLTETGDVVLVGALDGEVVAFSQNVIIGEEGDAVGEIRWLHVDPDHRNQGIGKELLSRTREVLRGQGVSRIRGMVLAGNENGAAFYERHGFDHRTDRRIQIGDETYEERVFELGGRDGQLTADVERVTVDGEAMYAYRDEGDSGSEGPFHPVYRDQNREELYTWLCGPCGSVDNAMDSLGRLECNECGNALKPTRWDSAYL